MRVVIIGGTGTIGSAIAEALTPRHEVISVGRRRGDHTVDIANADSIRALYRKVAPFDAVACVAGDAAFGPLQKLTDADFEWGWRVKLMGQVNVVRLALPYVSGDISFTLTSGVLSTEPTPGGAVLSIVNAGVEAFVRSAALEVPKGVRVNVVSPPWVSETLEERGQDPARGLPAAGVALAYLASIFGKQNGQVLDARDFA